MPSSVRGKVWCLAIGNELLINEELYKSCVSNSFNKFKDSEATMDCLEYIHLDITRTFPHLGIFQQVNNYLFSHFILISNILQTQFHKIYIQFSDKQ